MFYCPGCGFGFWHNWGVLEGLKPESELFTISGSSLAAVCYLCNLNFEEELLKCDRLRFRMIINRKETLKIWLEKSLPENCVSLCKKLHIFGLANTGQDSPRRHRAPG